MDTALLAAIGAAGAGLGFGAVATKALFPYAKLKGTKATSKSRTLSRKPPNRDCQAIGFYQDAIRNKDGSYTKGYWLNPNPTQFGHDGTLIDQISRWAMLFRAKLPTGTVIQFRMSNVPDPGEMILDHLTAVEDTPVDPLALQMHMLGVSYMLGECATGRFRLPRITVWVKTPEAKSAGSLTDQIKGIFTGGGSNLTTRLVDEEEAAYTEARKTFRLFEQECPVPFTTLSRDQTWNALYLSARQGSVICPPTPRDGHDVRDFLCAESITTNGWYVMHASRRDFHAGTAATGDHRESHAFADAQWQSQFWTMDACSRVCCPGSEEGESQTQQTVWTGRTLQNLRYGQNQVGQDGRFSDP